MAAPLTRLPHKVSVWVTNGKGSKLLHRDADIPMYPGSQGMISIDTSRRLQEVSGFGAALTGSSAWLIHQLEPARRKALLRELFDPARGIGISYLRITMGASDFSLRDYTYDDLPAGSQDPQLKRFSLGDDRQDVIPVLKEILEVAPGLRIMATPWSAPAWMKTNGRLAGGKLDPQWYEAYAHYFVKYLRALAAEGIHVDAVTVQNEPLHEAAYPSMRMEAAEQAVFIRDHLGPLFRREKIHTKIIAYDHNWDEPQYPLTILNDPQAAGYVAGSAFHAYAGDVSAMSRVHDAYPAKELHFTEISGGEWARNFSDNLQWNISNIFIGTMNNWSKSALLWNLALDAAHGPQNRGCSNCRGVLTLRGDSTLRNVEYYVIAHFSKFVRPGAYRIQSRNDAPLESVAFLNRDGGKVLVALNKADTAVSFTVQAGKAVFQYRLEEHAVVTLAW